MMLKAQTYVCKSFHSGVGYSNYRRLDRMAEIILRWWQWRKELVFCWELDFSLVVLICELITSDVTDWKSSNSGHHFILWNLQVSCM